MPRLKSIFRSGLRLMPSVYRCGNFSVSRLTGINCRLMRYNFEDAEEDTEDAVACYG